MAVYLAPGVFTSEIVAPATTTGNGSLTPAFIITANKGPLNTPTFCANSQDALTKFGTPETISYGMYGILSFLAQGSGCWVVRVGVPETVGQDAALDDVAIDISGNNVAGWGRIPLFTGIDFGRITLRAISEDAPLALHAAAVTNITYNESVISSTFGAANATLVITGTYTGCIDDSFVVSILSDPTSSNGLEGATFEVVRNSDGLVVADGTVDGSGSSSTAVSIGSGLSMSIHLIAGHLAVNDSFTFQAQADNRSFSVSVETGVANTYTFGSATYTDPAVFAAALNALLSGHGEHYQCATTTVNGVTVPQLQTISEGAIIQLKGTCAFASALGTSQYTWDNPRAHLLATTVGPFGISSTNNRVVLNDIGATTTSVTFSIPTGASINDSQIIAAINQAGVVDGSALWEAFDLTLVDGTTHIMITTTVDNNTDQLQLVANYSNLKTLRFAQTLGILYPYLGSYRGFSDTRVSLPAGGANPAIPASCGSDPDGAQCIDDSAYYANIVGFLVATSPGTWLNGYKVSVQLFTQGVGDTAGLYSVTISDASGTVVDSISNVSFDPRAANYIGNVVNPGTVLGGINGNAYVNWEARPTYLNNDPTDLATFEVRNPSVASGMVFSGMADGIPTDPAFSGDLDAAVIGSQADNTGIFSLQNPDKVVANLLLIPGFTSGAVIGQGLQLCQNRGDMLYIIDPPFGLTPQQVVDWHNGMLLSDLTAALDSSYGALYWGWLEIFDQFNNQNIWVPPSGSVASVYAFTAAVDQLWSAPAGMNRGILTGVDKVEYSPNTAEQGLLYGNGNAVNPIVDFPEGITVWGDRTLLRDGTPLDRVPVRMLLIAVKKVSVPLLRDFVFEPDDSTSWTQVQTALNSVLGNIAGLRGLDGYLVVCDATNNTPQRRQDHELWVTMVLLPTNTIEFVVLNIVVQQETSSFTVSETLGGVVGAASG